MKKNVADICLKKVLLKRQHIQSSQTVPRKGQNKGKQGEKSFKKNSSEHQRKVRLNNQEGNVQTQQKKKHKKRERKTRKRAKKLEELKALAGPTQATSKSSA